MKVQKVTVEESNQVDKNYQPNEAKQIKITEVDTGVDLGTGVYFYLNKDTTLLISKEFIDYFFERLKVQE